MRRESTPERPGVWCALGRRNYRPFVAGQLVSLVGTWTQSLAQTWLVFRLTGSPLWLGVATLCQQAPVFILPTVGGLLALTASMGIPYATLMPVFASKVLHGDARTYGWLMGASGVGALLAGPVVARHRTSEGTYRWIDGACGALGVTLVLFSLSPTLSVAIAVMVPVGAATMMQVGATGTLIQGRTPDALRGRVMAIWAMIFMGFAPVGRRVTSARRRAAKRKSTTRREECEACRSSPRREPARSAR